MLDFSHIRTNAIDDPPCAAKDDWGPAGSVRFERTPIVEGTSGIAKARLNTIAIAVRAPRTTFVWCKNSNGRLVSRVRIHEGDLHVMYSPFGNSMQFSLAPELCDPANAEILGSFRTAPEYQSMDTDPRAVLLRHFWAQQFSGSQKALYTVEPFAIARLGPVRVWGAIDLVSIGTRWHSNDQSVHGDLGARTIVEQGPNMRFLTRGELYHEFDTLVRDDDSRVPYKLA